MADGDSTRGQLPPSRDALDQIIDASARVDALIGAWMPVAGLGVRTAKFLIDQFNRGDVGSERIDVPPDSVLIQRLRDRADRIVETGEEFLRSEDFMRRQKK